MVAVTPPPVNCRGDPGAHDGGRGSSLSGLGSVGMAVYSSTGGAAQRTQRIAAAPTTTIAEQTANRRNGPECPAPSYR